MRYVYQKSFLKGHTLPKLESLCQHSIANWVSFLKTILKKYDKVMGETNREKRIAGIQQRSPFLNGKCSAFLTLKNTQVESNSK